MACRFPCLVDRIGLSSWSMLPRLRRCFALLMLLCMPFQALATLALTCEFVSSLDAACIEHDPSRLKRPPRFPLA